MTLLDLRPEDERDAPVRSRTARGELRQRSRRDRSGTAFEVATCGDLRSFPSDKIKVDRSFAAGVDSDAGSLAIIRAVRGIAAGFNLATTAEGIETEAQLRAAGRGRVSRGARFPDRA